MNYPIKLKEISETCSQSDANEKVKNGWLLLDTCNKPVPFGSELTIWYSLGLPEPDDK